MTWMEIGFRTVPATTIDLAFDQCSDIVLGDVSLDRTGWVDVGESYPAAFDHTVTGRG